MRTEKEFLHALQVIKEYRAQIDLKVKDVLEKKPEGLISTTPLQKCEPSSKELLKINADESIQEMQMSISDWLSMSIRNKKVDKRVIGIMNKIYYNSEIEYVNQITKDFFLKIEGAGLGTWEKFEKVRIPKKKKMTKKEKIINETIKEKEDVKYVGVTISDWIITLKRIGVDKSLLSIIEKIHQHGDIKYVNQITKQKFLKIKGVGLGKWEKFLDVKNMTKIAKNVTKIAKEPIKEGIMVKNKQLKEVKRDGNGKTDVLDLIQFHKLSDNLKRKIEICYYVHGMKYIEDYTRADWFKIHNMSMNDWTSVRKLIPLNARKNISIPNTVEHQDLDSIKELNTKLMTEIRSYQRILNMSPLKKNNMFLKSPDILGINILDMGLSTRTLNSLKNQRIETILDISKYQRSDIIRFKDFGGKCMSELEKRLLSYGIVLD